MYVSPTPVFPIHISFSTSRGSPLLIVTILPRQERKTLEPSRDNWARERESPREACRGKEGDRRTQEEGAKGKAEGGRWEIASRLRYDTDTKEVAIGAREKAYYIINSIGYIVCCVDMSDAQIQLQHARQDKMMLNANSPSLGNGIVSGQTGKILNNGLDDDIKPESHKISPSPSKRIRLTDQYLHRTISSPPSSPFQSNGDSQMASGAASSVKANTNQSMGLMHQNISANGGAATTSIRKELFLIGVAGGTASGKTTVCDKIIQELHDHRVVLISQDSYYRGLTEEEKLNVHQYNFDHPDAIDSETLFQDIVSLKEGNDIRVPVYDFATHSRKTDECRIVKPADVVIIEGILVLQFEKIRDVLNMKIFVDTDDDVRLARRIQRDTQERGRDVNGVIMQYTTFVKPMFDAHVLPSKKFADIIIPWARGDNNVAIDLIVQHIRTKLGTNDLRRIYPLLSVIQSNFQIRGMHTIIRDKTTSISDFIFYADRLIKVRK